MLTKDFEVHHNWIIHNLSVFYGKLTKICPTFYVPILCCDCLCVCVVAILDPE